MQVQNVSSYTLSTQYFSYLIFIMLSKHSSFNNSSKNSVKTPAVLILGQYQPDRGMSECTKCPAGYYCRNESSETPCPENYYCPAGSSFPKHCPDGTYSKPGDVTLVNASQCRNCITGSYCRAGKIFGPCAGGYYCKSRSPHPNPSGNYPIQVEAGPCPVGYYCPNGTLSPIPCPNNTLKDYEGGNGLRSDCKPCPAGKQCFKGLYFNKITVFSNRFSRRCCISKRTRLN